MGRLLTNSGLGIGRVYLDYGAPISGVAHVHQPRPAAHLAVFDVLLVAPTSWVECDLVCLTAMRAMDDRFRLGGSVADGKLRFDLLFRPVPVVTLAHCVKIAR